MYKVERVKWTNTATFHSSTTSLSALTVATTTSSVSKRSTLRNGPLRTRLMLYGKAPSCTHMLTRVLQLVELPFHLMHPISNSVLRGSLCVDMGLELAVRALAGFNLLLARPSLAWILHFIQPTAFLG